MPIYTYRARKENGDPVVGELQADSEKAALDALHRQGVFPIEVRGRGEAARGNGNGTARKETSGWLANRRPRRDHVALFVRQLSDLLRAGVALHRALVTLQQQTSNLRLAAVIGEVDKEVSAGKSLADSMALHRDVFPVLFVSMVRAGERGGFLDDVLLRLAEFVEKDSELRGKIVSSLVYPILLVILGILAVLFLMLFFIPRFSQIFSDIGGNLPMVTRIVLGVSNFLGSYWIIPLCVAILGAFGYGRLAASIAGKRLIDRVKLGAPLYGDVIRKAAISRFTRTLGTLLKAGVPILEALQISKEALGNRVLMEDVTEAGSGVTQGRNLADMLRHARTFPSMMVDMVAVGEEGGNLDDVLINIADSYDRQVDRAVRIFLALFEPFLLMIMAALIGFIVVAMLLPVFTMSTMIK